MSALFDSALSKLLEKDRRYLENTDLPIITVSATFREDLKRLHGYPDDNTIPDVVLSRAHYSMALAVAATTWMTRIDPKTAWIVDPTNYVSRRNWLTLKLTENLGRTLARHSWLKRIKDFLDQFARQRMPIIDSITPPLLYLTQEIKKPILSLHITAGNVLASQGKTVFQIITDPHVRYDYLENAHLPNLYYGVFNEDTALELQEKSQALGHELPPDRVLVTGPPVDPRIVKARNHKQPWRNGPLKLCLATGGLGTNFQEIKLILEQILPTLKNYQRQPLCQLLVYAGTQRDFYQMTTELANKHQVEVGQLPETDALLRAIHHPQIMDANEQLIHYGFSWADGFITKPSGDMAYDAVAAGCFLLTLKEWGEWEVKIREIFEQKGIARQAQADHIIPQLEVLTNSQDKPSSWIERAMLTAHQIDSQFLKGSQQIVKNYRWLAGNKLIAK